MASRGSVCKAERCPARRPHGAVAATRTRAYAHRVSGKAFDLFSAYRMGRVPARGGYIVSSFMVDGSAYVRFEIVAYRQAQALRLSDEGLSIAADADKVYVVVEPAGYHDAGTEPWQRDARHRVPHTFAELSAVHARGHSRILISTTPVLASAVVTVARPGGVDFSFLFLPAREALDTISSFLRRTFQDECLVPPAAARRAAALIRARLAACHVGAGPW